VTKDDIKKQKYSSFHTKDNKYYTCIVDKITIDLNELDENDYEIVKN
jgi:hypothetical protein